ncbi:matrixin family metalloprotease [Archangium sp.]|uniref:matrixin family metalloprotease n=1 Tax=Archangium sp. TaxID=1872627 RepID=UPI002D5B54C5|nr:matrixin family metalloprotease [Archangium sp.]HYO57836.1 matrixin family metalloprotease [Archangium sp.]
MESNSQMGRNRPTPSTRRLRNVLAHAFDPPYGGQVHFDEAETWSSNGSAFSFDLALFEGLT